MIVVKFGGTSVGDSAHLRTAIDIVGRVREQEPVAVVVSALSGVTNQLVEATRIAARGEIDRIPQLVAAIRERHEAIAFELVQQKSDFLESFLAQLEKQIRQIGDVLRGIALVGEVTPRATDKIVAIGEKLSSVLFAYTMRLRTLPGVHIDSEEIVVTDEKFGEAAPKMEETTAAAERILRPELERNHIPVMGGFIGRSLGGATTTLGRGGSDYSAAIVGAALGASEIQIWTDVDGMMTCDPRLVKNARIIGLISYEEAAELAYFGAKVLHPKTITPAVEKGIPIRVLNTHNPESRGTLITAEGDEKQGGGAKAIAIKRGVSAVHVVSNQMLGAHGFLARLFSAFEKLGVSVDLITTSEVSVSVTIDNDEKIEALVRELETFAAVRVEREQIIVAIVGRRLFADPSLAERVFSAVDGKALSMVSYGMTGLNLSVVLNRVNPEETLLAIHHAIFEGKVVV
jgi:aspartate kinase